MVTLYDHPGKPLFQDEKAEAGSDEEGGEGEEARASKRKRKLESRLKIAELKQTCPRPEVVEVWDVTAQDPRLLVYLKARGAAHVSRWSSCGRLGCTMGVSCLPPARAACSPHSGMQCLGAAGGGGTLLLAPVLVLPCAVSCTARPACRGAT